MEIIKTIQIRDISPFYLVGNTQNDRFVAPVIGKEGFWEAPETLVTLQLIEENNIVFDIGANIGYFSILLSQAVGRSGKVFAFEPDRDNYRFLKASSILNNCDNLYCFNKAVSKENGVAQLFIASDNLGDHRLFTTPGRDSYEVETICLDSDYSETHVDFIKLDTQGSEFNILSGMKKTIQNNRSHLSCLMEFCPGILLNSGVSDEAFYSTIQELDARFYLPVPNGIMFGTDEKGNKKLYNSERMILEYLDLDSLKQVFEYMLSMGELYQDLVVFFSDSAEKKHLSKFKIRPFSGHCYF
ncbi:methyltransferase FkbM family [[Leptolyngbya] sp. PCC 7376]|uniref:FkbM family methyltransferase n=1 Tax=[Leptolyngbya] sp. PCC 7376 TaxID=111781 RepID=UPI00029F1196|nr:FkbM family methyltransferase [[Leptolyngbya] sp. PCC 7376]AFY40297.1 methyltransferase FkbM family [[Leptolyngbya] sp. PCC 7376]